jgi:structural maintenance of chromosome 4
LSSKGIDLEHNRFLILQGEVEQISLMKPKGSGPNDEGLLEYLEEIIGSDRFVEQIEQLHD